MRFCHCISGADVAQLLSSTTSAGPETPLFVITVGDPQKVGDPIKAHIVYTVSTRVSDIYLSSP